MSDIASVSLESEVIPSETTGSFFFAPPRALLSGWTWLRLTVIIWLLWCLIFAAVMQFSHYATARVLLGLMSMVWTAIEITLTRRWRQDRWWSMVSIRSGTVTITPKRGSRRHMRRYDLSEFAGVTRIVRFGRRSVNRDINAMFLRDQKPGAIPVSFRFERVPVYTLWLRRSRWAFRNIRLKESESQREIHETMTAMSEQLGIAILDPSVESRSGVSPRHAGESLTSQAGELADREEPLRQHEPMGLRTESTSAGERFYLPERPYAWRVALLLGVAEALTVWDAIEQGWLSDETGLPMVSALAGVAAACIVMGLIGYVRSRKKAQLVISDEGLEWVPARGKRASLWMKWETIRHVGVARRTKWERPSVLITTDAGDFWIGTGARRAILRWTRDAILAKASRVAQQGSEL
jgi:hypothetical protein